MILAMSLGMGLTSCNKDDSKSVKDDTLKSTDVYLTSLEPDVIVRGTGDKADYEKVIVEEIVRSNECKGEPVSGIVEFYYDGEMVFSIDFGNGECDGEATISYLDDDNILQSKVVNVWKLLKKHNEGNHRPRCFNYVFPVSFTMPDGSELTIESAEEWSLLRDWYVNNTGYEGVKPEINFPVDIIYEDGTTLTINTQEEFREAKMDCKQGFGAKCFSFNLPVSFTMPDESIITINARDDWALIKAWYMDNPGNEDTKPALIFPVEITMTEDGTVVTVNNQDEMMEIRQNCHPHGHGHGQGHGN